MKLAFSNIAWNAMEDNRVYEGLRQHGFTGLEIAPTRVFGADPYCRIAQASAFSRRLFECWGLHICSMQSIWYGRTEQVFGSDADRSALLSYTAHAVEFAAAMGCPNLVFGCPKNRIMPPDTAPEASYDFFRALAALAAPAGVTIALEANPVCYGTNFLNTTRQALDTCAALSVPGISVNLDLGACLYNGEALSFSGEDWSHISHVHISRPMLAPVEPNAIDALLRTAPYLKYFSVEMKNPGRVATILQTAEYVRRVLC